MITVGPTASGTGGGAQVTLQPAITVQDGDTIVLVSHIGTAAAWTISGPGPENPESSWRFLGNAGSTSYRPQMWVLDRAAAATGNIVVGRTPAGTQNSVAQVYRGVGDIYFTPWNNQLSAYSPADFPNDYQTTIPGTVILMALGMSYGTNNNVVFENPTVTLQGPAFSVVFRHEIADQPGLHNVRLYWSWTGTVTFFRLRLVLEPGAVVQPDFSLSVSPASLSITQGSTRTAAISITPLDGFTGMVDLQASGLPAGVTATFIPNPATGLATLELSAVPGAALGYATITITGISGALSHSAAFSLTVNPPVIGVNDLSTRQWFLQNATPFVAGENSILWHGLVYVLGMEFSGYGSEADACVVKDATGRVVWSANGSEAMQPVRLGRIGWIDGFVLDRLDSGLCMVYIK